ncbi:glycosyltransferase [Polynucleobacter sp. es-GGE-1]|uniref:glycosyltransferase family 2 protein n=1 Tax=Polynucleobacter sp. es-GGE-1 TaxID=1819724 RepID=UPI001C0CF1F4|nr:glycosyltransferase [Polynucleobacter sp. es-GGE-1]
MSYRFSVVITTYNCLRYLKECLISVLDQSYKNFEIIIVDDGSTDDTEKYLKTINSKFKYIKLSNSGGPARPRNIGIGIATGEWVCFLDADDYWFPNKLAKINEYLHNKNIEVLCHDEIIFDEITKKKTYLKNGALLGGSYKYLLKQGNVLSTSATTVKLDFIKNNKIFFDERKNYQIVEDYDFWLRLALCKGRFQFLHIPLGCYRVNGTGSLTSSRNRHQKNLKEMIKDHVYKVQNFDKNKEKLHKYILFRIRVGKLWRNTKLKNKKYKYIHFLVYLIKNYQKTAEYILHKCIK